jgi:DNA helicase II / ATP-dependent DNA helicase PcrA
MSNQNFLSNYNKLNQQQKQAVDLIEGPVMVIAGPGTGKTQILATRIANILLQSDCNPNQILCLTFTEAGATAMRQRLINIVGEAAYQIAIYTFHGFCNIILQENKQLLNLNQAELISDLEQYQFMSQVVDAFPDNFLLKRFKGDAYYDVNNFLKLVSNLKRERLATKYISESITKFCEQDIFEYDEYIDLRKKKKGELQLKLEGKKHVTKLEKTKAALQVFEPYQNVCKQNNRYDFDDMIGWVLQLFTDHPQVLQQYQEQFLYILADEYQDTNGSQNQLLMQLISFWGQQANVFVVGDDDQSIYRFQGANLENMLELKTHFGKNLQEVVLTQNYRSVPLVLQAATQLINNNQGRLIKALPHLEKNLIASLPSLQGITNGVSVTQTNSLFEEEVYVTEKVKELIAQGTPAQEIAILYRKHAQAQNFIPYFEAENIPYYLHKASNLLQESIINQLVTIITYIAAELQKPFSGNHLLFEILHYPYWQLTPLTIAKITNESRNKNYREVIQNKINEQAGQLLFNNQADENLFKAHNTLEDLIKQSFNLPIMQWMQQVVHQTGLLAFAKEQENNFILIEQLHLFFDYVQQEAARNKTLNTKTLALHISDLKNNEINIPYLTATGKNKGVQLLTFFAAKGLEFEHVFMPRASTEDWEKASNRSDGFIFPENIFKYPTATEATEELRRLFFVGLTRAKLHGYISFPLVNQKNKDLLPSQFVTELGLPASDIIHYSTSAEVLHNYSSIYLGLQAAPKIEELEKTYVATVLEKFTPSHTSIHTYLDCPLKFYYTYIVKMPEAPSEALVFGNIIHKALEIYLSKMVATKTYPPYTYLENAFIEKMKDSAENFNDITTQRLVTYGKQTLAAYYKKEYEHKKGFDLMVLEKSLTSYINGVPFRGFIDALQYNGNQVEIIDFKTGSFQKAKTRYEFVTIGDKNQPIGGKYWRQAVLYTILFNQEPRNQGKVLQNVSFRFLELNDKGDFDTHYIQAQVEEIEAVKKQVVEVWEKIQDHQFYTGCGNEKCWACNMNKGAV